MHLFGRKIFLPLVRYDQMRGTWQDRLFQLFDCGVDFAGKTVLDAGCYAGVVAYEVAKQKPAFIHGIDHFKPAIKTAQMISDDCPIASRFDHLDLVNDAKLRKLLEPSYDVVLFMSVWQHIHKLSGAKRAGRLARTLAARCSCEMVTRMTPKYVDEFSQIMAEEGFHEFFRGDRPHPGIGYLVCYRRSNHSAA